jgi:hypothetical protein
MSPARVRSAGCLQTSKSESAEGCLAPGLPLQCGEKSPANDSVGGTHRFAEWWVLPFGRLDRSLDVSPIDLLVGGECDRQSSASRLSVRVPFINGCLPDPVKVQVIDPDYGCDPAPNRPMYDSRFVPVDCRLRELHSNLRVGMEPVASHLRETEIAQKVMLFGTYPATKIEIGLHVDVAGVEVFGSSPNHNRFSAEYLPQGSRHQQVPLEPVGLTAGLS